MRKVALLLPDRSGKAGLQDHRSRDAVEAVTIVADGGS
jgi:hypothetical protein